MSSEEEKYQSTLSAGSTAESVSVEADPLAANYGDAAPSELRCKIGVDIWERTEVGALTDALRDRYVLVRGDALMIRTVGKNMAFLVVRNEGFTVQCVVTAQPDVVSPQMVKYVAGLSPGSIVDIAGVVSVPTFPIEGVTQQVEIQVQKLYSISWAMPTLPPNIEDAACSEADIGKALQAEEQLVRVDQDTCLKSRVLKLRIPANQGIFYIQSKVEQIFRNFCSTLEGFLEINTPLVASSSEDGAVVFVLDSRGQPTCLAPSPQLYRQMAVCAGWQGVYEVGPVFREEDSDTHKHLCEFVGLNVEMEIKEDYFEVLDVVDRLFVTMFDILNNDCVKELEVVGRQYPFVPLKYSQQTLRLTFEAGIQMLKDVGVEVDPFGDLNTEAKRKLGQLVLEKYGTEFYILHGYPLVVRPFYTMPCRDNPAYSNSFDVFIRGEEVISGGQRVHDPNLLAVRAKACGIDAETISGYIDAFKDDCPCPHGWFGLGLERLVMLFCGLDDIRKTTLFPRT